VDHRTDLLSQRAVSKTKLPHKTEKQTEAIIKYGQQRGWVEYNLPQRKGAGQINKSPVLNSQ
jgi:hypothetical protein